VERPAAWISPRSRSTSAGDPSGPPSRRFSCSGFSSTGAATERLNQSRTRDYYVQRGTRPIDLIWSCSASSTSTRLTIPIRQVGARLHEPKGATEGANGGAKRCLRTQLREKTSISAAPVFPPVD
jgi:hypothetical protein